VKFEPPKVELRHDVQLDSIVGGAFLARVAEENLGFVHQDGWRTVVDEPELGRPLMRMSSDRRATTLYELDDVLLLFGFFAGHVYAAAAATDPTRGEALLERLHELLPPPDPSSKHEVPVTFWTYGPQGPQQSWRSISVPGWDEIAANYRERTRRELGPIMQSFRPASGGQLILWHGPAGTGKTFALRAARLGMAGLVPVQLHRRPGRVLRSARRLPDVGPARAGRRHGPVRRPHEEQVDGVRGDARDRDVRRR
jgi:hypothetical protein